MEAHEPDARRPGSWWPWNRRKRTVSVRSTPSAPKEPGPWIPPVYFCVLKNRSLFLYTDDTLMELAGVILLTLHQVKLFVPLHVMLPDAECFLREWPIRLRKARATWEFADLGVEGRQAEEPVFGYDLYAMSAYGTSTKLVFVELGRGTRERMGAVEKRKAETIVFSDQLSDGRYVPFFDPAPLAILVCIAIP
jgi:hypothetical protein